MAASASEGATFAIFDYLNDPVAVTDLRFDSPGPRVVYVNDSFTSFCGLTKEELLRQPLSTVNPGLLEEGELATLERCCRDGRTYRHEGALDGTDGNPASMVWHIAPVFDDARLEYLLCFVKDVAESPEVVSALRASDRQLDAIFEHSPTEIYLKDAQGRYVKINRQFEKLFNVRDEDLRGKLPHDAHYKDLADRTRAHDLQVLRTGKVVVREEEAYLENPPDAFPHVLHTIKFPIFENGEIAGLGAIVTDITDMRRAEQAVRESERRLRDFAEIAADWFWETDETLKVTYISDVHRYITGIPDEQIIGRTREELFRENIYRAGDPAIHLRTLDNYWESMVEYSVVRPDGHEVIVHDRASPFFDIHGNFKGYRGVGRDITEQKRLNERITWQATRDPLTGVLNRREFEARLDKAIANAQEKRETHVLCFTDLNRFKLLNDTLGHAAGDYSLKTIVEKILEHIGAGDVLGRIGGDEFGIIMEHTGTERARQLAARITRSIKNHAFEWQGRRFNIALSIGLAPIDEHTNTASELMARVDSACYRAKADGDSGVWVSDENEAIRLRAYADILRSLAHDPADLSGNVQLVGQPIRPLSCPGDGPPWYEVLLRLVGEDGRYYRPCEFIRLAERHGKMPLVDHWVLEQALAAHARLVERVPGAILSLNIAENSLTFERLQTLMDDMLSNSPIEPANLCFEIGEATAMIDLERTTMLTRRLAEQGFLIALDEFGGGPSSFECLKKLPVNYLKLYGDLVRELGQHDSDLAILEAMLDLSRRLGVTMVAVQVETARAVRALRHVGIEYGQGEALAAIRPLNELVCELADTAHPSGIQG